MKKRVKKNVLGEPDISILFRIIVIYSTPVLMSCLRIIHEFLRDNHLIAGENPDLPTKRIDIMKLVGETDRRIQ